MKNSNNSNGNRTIDLPACGEVPQTTAPLRSPSPLLTKVWVIFLSSPSDWSHNIIRPRDHPSKSCSFHQQFVPSSGQHQSSWRHLRPITIQLISVHLSEGAYWAFTGGHLEVYAAFWPVIQRLSTDVGRLLVEEIFMVSRRQNCKRHDRQKIWSEAHKGSQHQDTPKGE